MDKTCNNCTHAYTALCAACYGADSRDTRWAQYPDQAVKADDRVNHPSHYTAGGVECIDGILAAVTGLSGFEAYCTGNAIKYLWRWRHKGGAEDLRKAQWYIDRLLEGANDR